MGGGDREGQQLASFPLMRRYAKSYKKVFFYIMDIAVYNKQLHPLHHDYRQASELYELESGPGGATDRRDCVAGIPATRQTARWCLIDAARGLRVGSLPSPDPTECNRTESIQTK